MDGQAVEFRCWLTSPFHTSRQKYANLTKCAPFIMGSTFRGAMLQYLIEAHCPQKRLAALKGMDDPTEVTAYHVQCDLDCPVRPFFTEAERIWYSFAALPETAFGGATRIALSRRTGSVAEGAIFNVETVNPGTPFTFEVFLFGEAVELMDTVREAVEAVGQWKGLGGYRSVGFGRFAVEGKPQVRDFFEARIAQEWAEWPSPSDGAVDIEFRTPLVLGEGFSTGGVSPEEVAHWLAREVHRTALAVGDEESSPPPIERVDFRIRPDFVGRFSYERGLRENRLVAWKESRMTLHLADGVQIDSEQLAIAAILGIGEWNRWGFGRFALVGLG